MQKNQYTLSERPCLKQVIDTLDKAFAKIPDNTKLISHSEHGLAVPT